MENDQASSSDLSTNGSSNSENLQTLVNQCKELSDDECKERDKEDFEPSLNLKSVSPDCEPSDIEQNNKNSLQQLSAVIEHPEELSEHLEDAQSIQDEQKNKRLSCILRERIESLREVMKNLKEELRREIELLRKETEELQMLRERNDTLALEEAAAAARAAAVAYAAESPLSNTLDVISEDTIRELTILEYKKKLAKYQDEHSFNQAEKRYNTRWKMVANAYKQKLIEVERLCNEELEKVQRNANDLRPLKEMISQWYSDEENHGDSIKRSKINVNLPKNNVFDNDDNRNHQFQKIDAEVNMAPEIFVARFKTENLLKKERFYRQT